MFHNEPEVVSSTPILLQAKKLKQTKQIKLYVLWT